MREVDLIERMRVRRAWEASLPPAAEPGAEEKRQRILAALERDEWACREREIGSVQELRLQLAESLLKEHQRAADERAAERLRRAWTRRRQERDRKLGHIRRVKDRQLRKLDMAHRGLTRRYKRPGVLEETLDRASELYGPVARHGVDPRRQHEKLQASLPAKDLLCALEMMENLPPTPRPAFDFNRHAKPPPPRLLCIRETRWTEDGLATLLDELRCLREPPRGSALGLVTRIYKPETPPETPSLEVVDDVEEKLYQDSVLLQKVIKGRAVQSLMFQGLERCRELISELKSTHALSHEAMQEMYDIRHKVLAHQREAAHYEQEEARLQGLVKQIEGMTLSSMLDFLNKELMRLLDERRLHALVLLAERVRSDREADEAGRRQAEERRRREHDEMFKQIVKMHQDTVEVYLEEVVAESLGWAADDRARELVRHMAASIDQAAEEAHSGADAIEEEELVADLLQSFVLPEVQKRVLQERHRRRQQRFLMAAHEEVFGRVLEPKPEHGAHAPAPPAPPPLISFPAYKFVEPIPELASVIAREAEQPTDEACWGISTKSPSPQETEQLAKVDDQASTDETFVGLLERLLGRSEGSSTSSSIISKGTSSQYSEKELWFQVERSEEPSEESSKEPSQGPSKETSVQISWQASKEIREESPEPSPSPQRSDSEGSGGPSGLPADLLARLRAQAQAAGLDSDSD